jgi:hypothetical protein
MSLNL